MTYIIADACVNFRSWFEASKMIDEVAATGCDCIKFQMWKEEHIAGHPRFEELKKIILTENEVRYLYWRTCGKIDLMITPFYPEAVGIINNYVKQWKIREKDNLNWGLIDKCLSTGKNVLISMQDPKPRTYLIKQLYCIPEYPPKQGHDILNNYKGFAGASCHYPNIEVALDFVRLGADFLEVHCIRDLYGDDAYEPIDCKVSLTMSELKELVKRIREME
jgi:sialic acid synthase SpsE